MPRMKIYDGAAEAWVYLGGVDTDVFGVPTFVQNTTPETLATIWFWWDTSTDPAVLKFENGE